MTDDIDLDVFRQKQNGQPMLPFPGNELDRSGMRLTRAEFARFMEVSKQAVGDWVKSGKIVLGADGRLDPRQAVSQLLRSTDPARLRSKVLAPLVKDVGKYQQRIAELERRLEISEENVSFEQDAVMESLDFIDLVVTRLREEWKALCELDPDTSLEAVTSWIDIAKTYPSVKDIGIISFAVTGDESEPEPLVAPENIEGGCGNG